MRKARVFGQLLRVQGMVIQDVTVQVDPGGGDEVLVVSVRPDARSAGRCAQCRRPCPGYDCGVGTRRWRTVDTGTTRTFLQAAAPRVRCPEHGVLVAHVPWARPGAKCTYLLEGHLRVAGEEHGAQRGGGVLAVVLADGQRHRGAGGGGFDREDRSARRVAQDRDRRDRLP
jgi:hypothetical protein